MKILLFDVDGTLIDSLPGIQAGFFSALDRLGAAHPPAEFSARIAGPPMEVTFASLGLAKPEVETAFSYYMEHARGGGWAQASAFAGMEDLLARLKEQGFVLATATSKGEGFARQILKREGMLDYFSFLGAAEESGPRRAKDAVIEYVLAANGWDTDTHRLLMIGDRSHDIEGAAKFGIDTIAVTWGYGTPEEWQAAYSSAEDASDLERKIHDYFA